MAATVPPVKLLGALPWSLLSSRLQRSMANLQIPTDLHLPCMQSGRRTKFPCFAEFLRLSLVDRSLSESPPFPRAPPC